MSDGGGVDTLADEVGLGVRMTADGALGPEDDDGEDDDDHTQDADRHCRPVREHQGRGVKNTAYFNWRPESILETL